MDSLNIFSYGMLWMENFELSSKESDSEDNDTSEDNDGMESKVAKVIIVEMKNLIKATEKENAS